MLFRSAPLFGLNENTAPALPVEGDPDPVMDMISNAVNDAVNAEQQQQPLEPQLQPQPQMQQPVQPQPQVQQTRPAPQATAPQRNNTNSQEPQDWRDPSTQNLIPDYAPAPPPRPTEPYDYYGEPEPEYRPRGGYYDGPVPPGDIEGTYDEYGSNTQPNRYPAPRQSSLLDILTGN